MKVLGYLSKLMMTAILVSTMSVMTTIYIVDQYVQAVLDRFHLSDIQRPSLSVGGMLEYTQPGGGDSQTAADAAGKRDEDQAISAGGQTSDQIADSTTDSTIDSTTDSIADLLPEEPAAEPVFGSSIQSGSIVMTADEFNEKRKILSDEDKMEIFAIMMNKLPQAELQKLSEWLEDGITDEELIQVEGVINAYLEEEDIARLLSILNRY